MRIRVHLLAPFADIKLLLPVPDTVQTVSDVKRYARQSLSSLRELAQSSKDLLLEIDGFELLPGSLLKDVVEDKDVVTIRLRAGSSRLQSGDQSRKRESTDISVDVKRRKVDTVLNNVSLGFSSAVDCTAPEVPMLAGHRSDRSPSSSSSSDSSSSSASSSSTDSSFSSDSSASSSSSVNSTAKAKPKPSVVPPLPPTLELPAPCIPPGQGKASTHERNERRKRARQLQKLQAQESTTITEGDTAPERISFNVNGDNANKGDTVSYITSELPVPRSMANRNKKKGFLREMINVQGTKTVFGEDAQGSSTPLGTRSVVALQNEEREVVATSSSSSVDDSTMPSLATPTKSFPATPQHAALVSRRVIPPSEMDLPNNVFVTHQIYDRPGYAQKGRRRGRVHYDDSGVFGNDQQEAGFAGDGIIATDLSLPISHFGEKAVHGIAELESKDELPTETDEEHIWTKAENEFETLVPMTSKNIPPKGSKLVWKELQLDMYSFSPQLKVQIGEIKENIDGKIGIDRFAREDADEDDPYNGQERGLVLNHSDLEAEAGRYRLI